MVQVPVSDAGDPLCLLTVHAHPDDEASKGASTVARYFAEGVRTVERHSWDATAAVAFEALENMEVKA